MSFAKWLRLPSGMAEPELGKGPTRAPQQSAKSFGEVLIWSEGGRIYFSESGNEAQELRLGDTPQARHLRELLEREGVVAGSPRVLQHRLILVGGGGNAIHWGGAQSSNTPDNASRAPKVRASNRAASHPAGKPSAQTENPDRTPDRTPKQN